MPVRQIRWVPGTCLMLCAWAIAAAWLLSPAAAQEPADTPAADNAPVPNAQGYRQIAPGIIHTIYPDNDPEETFSRHDIVELLNIDPDFGERPGASPNLAKDVRYTHNVWGLEFRFKPVRLIEVNIPNPDGHLERKLIWYLLYSVKNTSDQPVTFVPRMFLRSHDSKVRPWVPDTLIPLAVKAINQREDANRKMYDSVTISEQPIPPAVDGEDNEVWGIATFEGVDPATDEFSIYIQGLTNAYKMEIEDGKRKYRRKTLKINFWRPGDEFFPDEREIRYGVPGKVDYEWVYM